MKLWWAVPLEEERQRAGRQCRRCACELPAQGGPVGTSARSARHIEAQAGRDPVDVVGRHRPPEQPMTACEGLCHGAAELRCGCLLTIDDRHKLYVLVPERHDPIRGAPARMSAAG